MKPIETTYNGIHFRSRLEARWAIFFDHLRIHYHYEPEGYQIGNVKYLPDFYLPQMDIYAEIKPHDPPQDELEKVQLFSEHKPILLIVGPPYASFSNGNGERLDYSAYAYIPHPDFPKEKIIWGHPAVFIQCRECDNIGWESRGLHFSTIYPNDTYEHGAFSGFCCSEKAGVPNAPKLIEAYDKAIGYKFW